MTSSAGRADIADGGLAEHSLKVPLESLVTAIAAFAAVSTGLPMPDRMPGIVFDDPRRHADLIRASAGKVGGEVVGEILAFYEPDEQMIHLPAGWVGLTPAEQSVLVHELTHHLQASAGQRYACPEEREKAAYRAQEAWLALFGTDLAREFQLDKMYLLVVTTCGMP